MTDAQPIIQPPAVMGSRFEGDLTLRVLLGPNGKPIPTANGRAQWLGCPPAFSYVDKAGFRITFACGEPTDLGSTPQWSWSAGFSPDGQGVEAFTIHDQGYRTRGTHVVNGVTYRTRPEPYTRKEHDDMLLDGLKLCGVSIVRRNLIWAAVRVGGASAWGS
jgi:hypothetical protein